MMDVYNLQQWIETVRNFDDFEFYVKKPIEYAGRQIDSNEKASLEVRCSLINLSELELEILRDELNEVISPIKQKYITKYIEKSQEKINNLKVFRTSTYKEIKK